MKDLLIGIVDADLLDGGTRHPNLALLKIAGFLHDNGVPFELIKSYRTNISKYDHVFMSKVFTFTKEPPFYTDAPDEDKSRFHIGGTGYYATEAQTSKFREMREDDMTRLERDEFLCSLPNKRGGENATGINMARQMPFYGLYDEYIEEQVAKGVKRSRFKDYADYSIGFLTRKCYRHCPFCVNRLENGVVPHSRLEWFHDTKRPHVYFLDDNFLASPYNVWKPLLQDLLDRKISFQFRQGLDERQLAESEHGEEMAQMLSEAKYCGDYIFAFDNWKDRDVIEKALKVWKKYAPKKSTKFYLFCGFRQSEDKERFYKDVWELFSRIRILMRYGCLGYVMRHEDYHKSPIPNFYVQMARWVNQPAFFRKKSFWEFCLANQIYHEKNKGVPETKETAIDDYVFDKNKACMPVKTVFEVLEMFPEHRDELIEMFNYKMEFLRKENNEQ